MLIVGICDADTSVRVVLNEYIQRYRRDTGLAVQVLAYNSGEKLLRHYPLDMDLIFLEIPFSRMSGIEIARRIRAADAHVRIVFLTTVLSHVLEAYEVQANNYFIKPLRYERFYREAEEARARRGEHPFFIERNTQGVYKLYKRDIRYIETDQRGCIVHAVQGDIPSPRRMKAFEVLLFEENFVRIHAGYLANLLYFERLERDSMILQDGVALPVSRHRRGEVMARINSFYDSGESDER